MKLSSLLVIVLVVSIVSFLLDGLWHMVIFKSTYDQIEVLLAPVSMTRTGIPWQFFILALITNYIFLRFALNASGSGLTLAAAVESLTLGNLALAVFYNVISMFRFANWPVSVSILDIIWHSVNGFIAGFVAVQVARIFTKSTSSRQTS
ncbi:MAG: DUF2177 family protein [Ignavibacteria bacterium]|nr:DUF2177 family protein [Ignavibacteria bacterium]